MVKASNRILIFGLDNPGIITALLYSSWGHQVFCFDFDIHKVKMMQRGLIGNHWPDLQDKWSLYHENITFLSSLEQISGPFDLFVLAFDTYQDNHANPAMDGFYDAIDFLGKYPQSQLRVLIKTMVTPYTNDRVLKYLSSCFQGSVQVIYNPFNIKGKNIIDEMFQPQKTIVGCHDDEEHFFMNMFLMPWIQQGTEIIYISPLEAELASYATLSYEILKDAYANEWALISSQFEVSPDNILYGIDSHLKGGLIANNDFEEFQRGQLLKYLKAFPYQGNLMQAISDIDKQMIDHIVQSCERYRKKLNNSKVAIIGLETLMNSYRTFASSLYLLLEGLNQHDFEIWIYDDHVLHQVIGFLKGRIPIHYGNTLKETIKDTAIILINQEHFNPQSLDGLLAKDHYIILNLHDYSKIKKDSD